MPARTAASVSLARIQAPGDHELARESGAPPPTPLATGKLACGDLGRAADQRSRLASVLPVALRLAAIAGTRDTAD
jgi:hypothetical protein